MPNIKSWPEKDRPREKLFRHGEHSLTDSELIALLLGSGTKGRSAVDLAREILAYFSTFNNMSHTDMRRWQRFKGLGQGKIARIKAAFEIGRRFREERLKDNRFKISSSRDAAGFLMPRMSSLKKEVFKTLLLNSQGRIIEVSEAEEGSVNQAYPIIREVFQRALEYFAAAIICVHNHPSGDPRPSREDKEFTRRLVIAAEALEIKVLDHIIIGGKRYFSFADKQLI